MKTQLFVLISVTLLFSCTMGNNNLSVVKNKEFVPFTPPVSYEKSMAEADSIVKTMSVDERIEMIGGHNFFFVKDVKKANLPALYLSDATQGVHLRKDLDSQLVKSVAMPCPIMLTSTWNRELANEYARCIGEECRAGGIAVLLGPGMNIYRISQNGRNFEYFGEDPFLTSRMVENYITGIQSTGTIATLKHFLCNNTDHRRRNSNSIVSERTLHEIYLPAFKAGVDAGAMAVMTSYNQVNGEWSAQSDYVVNKLLRHDLGFKWLVMSDWWSVWNPEKAIKSGLDLDMPGEGDLNWSLLKHFGNTFLRSNTKRLLSEGKVKEDDINRMAKHIIGTELAMELDKRPVKDASFLSDFPKHEEVALQTAREGIVLLKNENNILPIKDPNLKILATGFFMKERMSGGGSADVEGYDWVTMIDGLKNRFGNQVIYSENPTKEELEKANVIILSVGTHDTEGNDKNFNLPDAMNKKVNEIAAVNPNVVVVMNAGGGVNMTAWNDNVAAILYSWYPGQAGNRALAEILAGDVSPSGKLPITIEKKFEDSPGYPYLPAGEELYEGWENDNHMEFPTYNIDYKEGVFVGYRWYEAKKIEPLYPFGYGLSYTSFDYSGLKLSAVKLKKREKLTINFVLENSGETEASEIAQLYIHDVKSSVERPVKELKNFIKVKLKPGEKVNVELEINQQDLSYYDEATSSWIAEPGTFHVLIGTSSKDIMLEGSFELTE
jgi:beta-glucosidase